MLFATPATASAPDLLKNKKRRSVLQQDGLWKACILTCCPDALHLNTSTGAGRVVSVRCANGIEPAEASAETTRSETNFVLNGHSAKHTGHKQETVHP